MVIATLNGTVEKTVLVLISFPVERSTLQWSWAWWMALTGDDSSRSPWKSLRIARANDVVPSDILYFIVASSSSFSSNLSTRTCGEHLRKMSHIRVSQRKTTFACQYHYALHWQIHQVGLLVR